VVDGMSDDGTRDVIKGLMPEHATLHLIDNRMKFTPYALNLGIKADPDADFVQIIGARHIVSSNYMMKSIKILESSSEIWCVGGRIVNEFTSRTGMMISKALNHSFGMGAGNFRTLRESGYTDTVTSPMYPARVFNTIGYFDEELTRNQDDEFNFRVKKAGGRIWYEHEIFLRYYVRTTYKDLLRQFYQYAYWKVYVNKKHRTITTYRQVIPFLFLMYLISLIISATAGLRFLLIYSLPLAVYVLMNLMISLQLSKGLKELFPLMYIFTLLHVSYGLGYLLGAVDFILLRKKPSNRMHSLSR